MKIACPVFLYILVPLVCFSGIVLSPDSWNVGTIEKDNAVQQDLVISNTDSASLTIEIIPTCDCIFSDTNHVIIAVNEKKSVKLFLNPKDEEPGNLEKYFFITFPERKDLERIIYKVTGTIAGTGSQTGNKTIEVDSSSYDAEFWIFYFPGCKICENLLRTTIPDIEKRLSIKLKVNKRDLNNVDSLKEYESMFAQLNEKEREVPVLLIGKTLLQGGDEIAGKMENAVREYLAGSRQGIELDKNFTISEEEIKKKMALIPAFFTGLIDGINPCAFATLVSLLTALTLAGKRKREVLLMGIFFTLAVFITYFLIGLGFFTGIKALSSFPILAFIIRWGLVAVLVVFAALSMWDYYLIRNGRAGEMVLQLPDFFKKQIQKSIKKHVRSTMIGLSAFFLGVLVSLFEMACTGQVYVPFITYIIFQKQNLYGYFLLLVYNIAFIIPLVTVFAITYLGLGSKVIVEFFQKHMGKTKIALAILFIGLALLTIFLK